MKRLVKRNTELKANVFHKSGCPCETQCVAGCTGTGNAGDLHWCASQVQANQQVAGTFYKY